MVNNLRKMPEDFPEKEYIQAKNAKELLQKELDVSNAQGNLIKKRIITIKDFMKNIPASDPQYGILHAQIRMDEIEIDEIAKREENLKNQLEKLG